MAVQHMTDKVTSLLSLPLGRWTTVVKHDWPYTISSKYVDVMLYVNLNGVLTSGREVGEWTVRALRINSDDETAVESYPLFRRGAGPAAGGFVTHLWMGANPGGFLWQIMPRTEGGIIKMGCTTRYSKVHTK